METLDISKAWLFRIQNGDDYLIGELTYMGKVYVSIKVKKPNDIGMLYRVESFKCHSEEDVNDDDKRLLINHIVINILLLEGTRLSVPFLYFKYPNGENMDFIRNYIPECFSK